MRVPLVDLKAQYHTLAAEFRKAIEPVLESQQFIGGPEVEAFNREFSSWLGVPTVGVANGTDALYLAARALGLGPGDEFVLPSHTFIATAEAIALTGARPVFVDVDPNTFTLDPDGVRRALTPRTKAIVPVHLYGQPAAMAEIMELASARDLFVIEDSAQAHGALYRGRKAGTLGDVSCFSFYPGKNLGAFGDAGAVASKDPKVVEEVRRLANHGRTQKYLHTTPGVNSRLDAIQAAVLRVKLRHLDTWNRRRQEAAALYAEKLRDVPGLILPSVAQGRTHVYHLYVVQLDDRDETRAILEKAGVETGIHYPAPLHQQPAYAGMSTGPLPQSERLCSRILSLPMFPEITPAQIERVAQAMTPLLKGAR